MFSALLAQLTAISKQSSQQRPKSPIMGDLTYTHTQSPVVANQVYQVEDAQFVRGNRSYVFKANENLPSHYNIGLRNHDNLSYRNQGNFQQVP